MTEPLNRQFNAAIIHIAGKLFPLGFDVEGVDTDECAPFDETTLRQRLDSGKRMVVSSVGCDDTIYEDREVNYAFRAWHDWCHYRGGHDFTLAGERAVCAMQCEHIRQLYGYKPEWENILYAEIVLQAIHFWAVGEFPDDQRAFVERALQAAA